MKFKYAALYLLLIIVVGYQKIKDIKEMPEEQPLRGHFLFFMNQEVEIWKDVVGYEGLYKVSSLGRVKSLIVWRGTNERILKFDLNTDGYLQVKLHKSNVKKTIKIHKIVAMSFHGHNPDGYMVVIDHIDNNPLNNRADNLQIISQRENASKDKKDGTSDFIGVHWKKKQNKWESCIVFKKRIVHLGSFINEIDASNAYQKALSEINLGLDLNILYPKRVKSSIHKHVTFVKNRNTWRVKIKRVSIGSFKTEEEANNACIKAIKEEEIGLNIKEIYNKKTSKYKCVSYDKSRNKWEVKYKGKFICRCDNELDAHEAVKKYIANLLICS